MKAVILAAGRGTRLQSLTLERSKAMMPIAGKPITARVMDILASCGIRDFVIVAHPDDRELLAYFDGRAQFVFQAKRKGMADALSKAAALLEGDFILSACDNLVEAADAQRLVERFRAEKPSALLTLMKVKTEKISASGVVEMDGDRIRRIVEKPRPEEAPSDMASLPLYCFSPEILAFLPKVQPSKRGEYELQDAIQIAGMAHRPRDAAWLSFWLFGKGKGMARRHFGLRSSPKSGDCGVHANCQSPAGS